jgi:phage baseplate assembly protein W
MAVILGSKPVTDLKEFEDTAIGITLPLQIGNTAFNQSFKTFDQVRTNIKSLLLTKRKERVMQPFLGSGLHELVLDFNDDELSTNIEEVITSTLAQWLPYVNVDTIDIEQTDFLKDRNQVNISINFRIGDSVSLNQVTFTI